MTLFLQRFSLILLFSFCFESNFANGTVGLDLDSSSESLVQRNGSVYLSNVCGRSQILNLDWDMEFPVTFEAGKNCRQRKTLGPGVQGSTSKLNIVSGKINNSSYWIVGSGRDSRGILNITGSAVNIATRDLILSHNSGYGEVNISAGRVTVYGNTSRTGLILPGTNNSAKINISGGVLTTFKLHLHRYGKVNISHGGALEIVGDNRLHIQRMVKLKRIVAENGSGKVEYSYHSSSNKTVVRSSGVAHSLSARKPGRFLAWPANNGIWKWGNEIVVGYEEGVYKNSDLKSVGELNVNPHDYDENFPLTTRQSRSLDGGATWTMEFFVPLSTSISAPLNFEHPDSALKFRDNKFYYTNDRGRSWTGPFPLETFGYVGKARTDYIVLGPQHIKVFHTIRYLQGARPERALAMESRDGGQTFQPLGWMTSKPRLDVSKNFTSMPSTVRLEDGTLITAIRQRVNNGVGSDRKNIEIRRSQNGGTRWSHVVHAVRQAWNPAKLLRLQSGRLLLVYGYRTGAGSGIRYKISGDNGSSWGPEMRLREDATQWDFGYPQAVELPDGGVSVVYYYSSGQNAEQSIVATKFYP